MKHTVTAALIAAASSVAFAQTPTTAPSGGHSPADAAQPPQGRPAILNTYYSASAGVAHEIATDTESDLSANGDFSLTRYGAGVNVHYALPGDEFLVDHSLVYEFDDYNFSGTTVFSRDFDNGSRRSVVVREPWDDTHLLNYSLRGTYVADRDWSYFGGPILGIAAEDGADLQSSFTWGVTGGAVHRVSNDLSAGLGFVVAQGVEHDFTAVPLLLIDWQITDRWRIRNGRPQPGLRGTAGVEACYTLSSKWELSAGAAFDRRDFRLDDSGPAPDGVGKNHSYPVYVRAGYRANDKLSFVALAGVLLGGELRLENSDGHEVGTVDYENAPFLGISAAYTF